MNVKSSSEIGQIVRKVRRENHLTLDQLVVLSGISKGNLSKIENGQGNPSLDTLCRLARALNITLHIGPM